MTQRVSEASAILRAGRPVAFPTETVYGLGSDAFNERAVRSVFRAKGRPADNPLIVHVASLDQLSGVVRRVPASARRFMEAFFPGPLTLVMPRGPQVPDVVTAGLDTVGVRMPAHPVAHAFLSACGVPVAAPSANRSGRPSPTRWQAVLEDLDGRIPCILRGGRSAVGLESTVVDCTGRTPVVLRAGAVTLEALRAVVPATRVATPDERRSGRSPGLRHKHYAPRARVCWDDEVARWPAGRAGWIGTGSPPTAAALVCRCRTVAEYARKLFHFFRACDAAGLRLIACGPVAERGIGVAVADRIRRASGHRDA